MSKYVLVADSTLTYTFRDFPLLDFLPSAPQRAVPKGVYDFLKGSKPKTYPNGELFRAPYSIRKIEAALLQKHSREEVAVTDIRHAGSFINEDTEVIGISTMDPLGIGPLTISYAVLFGGDFYAWVRYEWEALIRKLNRLRAGKKAKLIVGGPGVWDFTVLEDEFKKSGVDYAVQGEIDDVANELFEQVSSGNIDTNTFRKGYITFDDTFHIKGMEDEKFLSRRSYAEYPKIEQIPTIVRPVVKDMVEIMRGCGIGCDFCEVTLRPSRYYPIEKILEEVRVNVNGGSSKAWLQTDEFFAYKHGKFFEPNEEALVELVSAIKGVAGVKHLNPTHGRIAPAAAHPELIEKLSKIMGGRPGNWIGLQIGLETGSDELAKKHMPAKTLPLRIGVDGSWMEIVWRGVEAMTRYYWRPAFTVQVGQSEETDEDNWDTVALINKLSNSYVDGRPFEFTVTPMVNVPLGKIKSRQLNKGVLTPSMLAVYYAAYRHLEKMARRDARSEAKGSFMARIPTILAMDMGSHLLLSMIEKIARKSGVDIEKAKNYGLEKKMIESASEAINS